MKKADRTIIPLLFLLAPIVFMPTLQAQEAQETFGTLFTSPEEREYLDYLRQDFVTKSQLATFDILEDVIPDIPVVEDQPEEEAPEVIEYKLGGIMNTREGRRMIWLNGRQVPEAELPSNIRVVSSGNVLALGIRANGRDYLLKPGQTINLTEGAIQESYQTVRQTPATPAAPAQEQPQANNEDTDGVNVAVAESTPPEIEEQGEGTLGDILTPEQIDQLGLTQDDLELPVNQNLLEGLREQETDNEGN